MRFGLVRRVLKAFSFSLNSSALCDLVTSKWTALHSLFEILWVRRSRSRWSRTVVHLRFGTTAKEPLPPGPYLLCTEHLARIAIIYHLFHLCSQMWYLVAFMSSWTWHISLLANSPPSVCILFGNQKFYDDT